MGDTTALGMIGGTAAGAAVSAGLGMVLGDYNDQRQLKQQQALQDQQIAGQKQMADYQQGLQMKTWNATSYEAQKAHMEAAGLNPGLMYGMGGGGGQTAGSGSGASVSGGQAPSGGREVQDAISMGMQMKSQMELLQAQKENIQADTVNKKAEAGNKDVDTEGKGLANNFEKWMQSKESGDGDQSAKQRGVKIEQNKNIADIINLNDQNAVIKAQAKNVGASTTNTEAETEIKKQAFNMLEKKNPMELTRIQQELTVYMRDPANTENAQWAKMLIDMTGSLLGSGVKGAIIKKALEK